MTSDQERLAVLRAYRDNRRECFKISVIRDCADSGWLSSRLSTATITPAGVAELERLELLSLFQSVADAHGTDLLYKVPAVRSTTWASYDIMLAKRPDWRLVEIEWDYDAGKFLSTLWAAEWAGVERRVESDTIEAACEAAKTLERREQLEGQR